MYIPVDFLGANEPIGQDIIANPHFTRLIYLR